MTTKSRFYFCVWWRVTTLINSRLTDKPHHFEDTLEKADRLQPIGIMLQPIDNSRPAPEQGRTLECLINVPVRVFISRKMPPYTGLIWHYTFIKKKKNCFFLHLNILVCTYWPHNFLETQRIHRCSCQQELVPLQFITGKASGRWSTEMLLVDTSSRHWLRLCFKPLCIQFVRFATLYSYLALYYY